MIGFVEGDRGCLFKNLVGGSNYVVCLIVCVKVCWGFWLW